MHSLSNIIVPCWAIFWIGWFIAALGTKRNTRSHARQFVGIRIILIVLVILLTRPFTHNGHSTTNYYFHNDVIQIIGVVMFVSGLLLAIWARLYLGRNWGVPMTEKQDPELVTSGPYRYIRHPIYTGILLATAGSVLASSFYWLLMLVFIGPYFIYSAVVEERLMLKLFPKTYPAYKNKTKMLIPFIF